MNIDGYERNPQIDEAYLMLGKARYYEYRYLPALEAFNYILYKYPTSNNVYQAKVWREKINIKMDNEVLAIKKKIIKRYPIKRERFSRYSSCFSRRLYQNKRIRFCCYLY